MTARCIGGKELALGAGKNTPSTAKYKTQDAPSGEKAQDSSADISTGHACGGVAVECRLDSAGMLVLIQLDLGKLKLW